MVSDKGGKKGYVVRARQKAYRGIRRGTALTKSAAAAIANAGRTAAGRRAMARKAAATRRRRGR
jgi:hypothetical protein